MNRRQQIALACTILLDVLGDDVGRPLVALVDAMAWQLDETDRLIAEVERLETAEPREYGLGEAIRIRQRQEP